MNIPEAQAALDILRRNRQESALPIDYYEGKHRLLFATDRFRNVFGGMFNAFADNFCAPVIEVQEERLAIRGFTAEDPDKAAEDLKVADTIWNLNRLGSSYTQAHRDALIAKDAYLIVWPDSRGIPVVHINDPRHVACVHDSEHPWIVSYAIKVWREKDASGKPFARMTLYYPDRIERYVSRKEYDGKGFPSSVAAFSLIEKDGIVPNKWGRCPVFHLVNRGVGGRGGRSELAPVIPINDVVNKLMVDMLVASEYVAYPQRYATGVEDEVDKNGNRVAPWRPGTERIFTTANSAASIGQLDAASFESPLALMHAVIAHIAAVTGTPPHSFYLNTSGAEWPSGEALKTAEARLIAKCEAATRAWGPVWGDAMTFAVAMVRGAAQSGYIIEPQWEPVASRSEREEMELAVMKKQIGLSNRQIQRELGYTEDEILTIEAEAEEEKRRSRDAAGTAFDSL